MEGLKKLAVDTLGGIPFLPEELAYVKAVLRQGGLNPCATEDIVLCRKGEEYVLSWYQLPGRSHQNVAYFSDGHVDVDPEKWQTRVWNATYFAVFNNAASHFTPKIVVWRPYANLWKLAAWLRQEIFKRNQ